MNRIALLFAMLFGVSFASLMAAADPTELLDKPGKPVPVGSGIARDRIERVIELLGSKNRVRTDDHRTDLPVGYRTADQVVVYLGIQDLLREGDPVMDALTSHLDDKRYSVSFGGSDDRAVHASVGSVCGLIMFAYIWCYEDEGLLEVVTCDQHPVCAEGLGPFWKKNRGVPLWKIQIEMIDHQIDYFKNLDLATARPPEQRGRKPPMKTLVAMRATNVATLESLRKSIAAAQEPYFPKSIERPGQQFIWLPWQVWVSR
jgi:hypothetical protein